MKRVIIAAALLTGFAVQGSLAAQQHQHGAAADTSRADSARQHTQHGATHPRPVQADTAHQRMMMHGDSAHRSMMHADSSHRQMMHSDSAHRPMMHADSSHRQMMHGDSAHHSMMHGDSVHQQMMHGDSAHHPMMHGDSSHQQMMHRDSAHAPMMHGEHGQGGATEPNAHAGHGAARAEGVPGAHSMAMRELGGGWSVMGMAQAYPILTAGLADEGSPLRRTEAYLTQPAVMLNLESPGQRFVLRTTLNFEGLTQPDGELTFGGWGEGFIDRRHPHTLLHEAMLSANLWSAAGGSLSISAGKGFAPYGTDDPMSRPVAKYPTNHHLSQILERWTANVVYLRGAWSIEAGWFGGQEPDGPYDFANIESFGDSWSTRLIRRFGGTGTGAPWEVSASYGSVAETHHEEKARTALVNGYVRHAGAHRWGTLYGLVEASRSEPEGDERGYYALLGETMAGIGRHRPYLRVELSTRPEYEREGGEDGFFRYDHDAHPVGSTRWLITSAGYGLQLSGFPLGAAPFVEAQHNRVWHERGDVDPRALFGRTSFWSLTAGFRIFLGSGGPMRMGSYGVLDDMSSNHRPTTATGVGGHAEH